MSLYPFQADTIARVVKASRICIALEMGLGKTRCAIESATIVGARRILVVAPKIGLVSWSVEVKRWAPRAHLVVLRPGQSPPPPHGHASYAVINYEALPIRAEWFLEMVRRWQPDLVILDECHYLKSSDAKRTKLIYGPRCDGRGGAIENVARIWIMSGTPSPNYTSELWTHLRALHPRSIWSAAHNRPMAQWEFRAAYSLVRNTPYGDRVIGSRNTDALRRAADGFFIRIKTADVLPDLPPIVWTREPVDAAMPALPEVAAAAAGIEGDALLDWLRHNGLALSTARRLLGLAKVAAARDWIEYFLVNNPGRPLVVFAHHRDVLAELARLLAAYQPLLVDGGTALADRVSAVEQFQSGRRRLWLGQMAASGTAITLTAASDVLFTELDWSPSVVAQAAARTHRIGQRKAVMARALTIPDTLDDAIARALIGKARALAVMFDNPSERQQA